ncbi:MAG TPA: hypothetical protein VJV23_04280 [Candidatus Polarisedimenticolia bacterium]|nr:hypothetical protein [Candidatus Polarisedimenticolia bacterium]
MVRLGALALALLLSAPPAWELVGRLGRVRTVYVDSSRIQDKQLLASIVSAILAEEGREKPVEIGFFVDRAYTPRTLPYPPGHKPHYRAKYNWIPAKQASRFVRLEPKDAKQPHGALKEIEESLPLP